MMQRQFAQAEGEAMIPKREEEKSKAGVSPGAEEL